MSEIVKGRRVRVYDVLARIAERLGIPRDMMGLGYGAYRGDGHGHPPSEEVNEDVRRRALIAAAPVSLFGQPLLRQVPDLPEPVWTGQDLPSRLGATDVARLEALTDYIVGLARRHGGQAGLAHAAATDAQRLLKVPAPDRVAAALRSALARLFRLAGWCCADTGLGSHTWWYLQRAGQLGADAADPAALAESLRFAGALQHEHGHPNDGLKLLQLGEHALADLPPDDPRAALPRAWLSGEQALALAALGHRDTARRTLAACRGGWNPPNTFERSGIDDLTARVHLTLGALDLAEPFAAAAVRVAGPAEHRNAVLARSTLATIHVTAGDSAGLGLAADAIGAVAQLPSIRARRHWLTPLTRALAARPGSDYIELARQARTVATTPA